MRKIFVLLFVFVNLYLSAQTTCQSAAPFCAGGSSGVTFPATTVQASPPPNAPAGPYYGCLGSTPNAAWYYMQIGTAGPLDVLIEGQLTNGNTGGDVDFICWGPFSSLTNVCNGLTATNTVDCSYSGSYTETLNIPNGIVGQYYMVLITNFSNITQNIVFDQINTQAAGAGNTDCNILQVANTAICAGSIGTITASNNGNLSAPNYSLNPGGLTSASGIFTVAPTVTTTYTIYVTGINGTGATVTQTATSTMSVNPQPLVAPTLTQTSCTSTVNAVNLHLTFNPATPAPSYTVAWSSVPSIVTSYTQTVVNSTTAGNINPNAYTVTLTAQGGCSVVTSFTVNAQPAPANFTLIPLGSTFSVTCAHPNVIIDASNSALSYTWNNGSAPPVNDSEALFNSSTLGTWTITGQNPVSNCVTSHTFAVVLNTVAPTGAVSPSFQNITCTSVPQTVSLTASPTVNVSHHIYSPGGGAGLTVSSHTAIFIPGTSGLYTDTIRNDVNGCYIVKTFSVASSDAFPTLNVVSSTNYTVGCNTHSVTLITINGDTPPPNTGGNVTYTLLPPAFTGTNYGFGSPGTFSLTTPGTWTAIIKSASNGCQTKIPFSIIQFTAGPDIAADVPTPILDCNTNSTTLTGVTADPHTDFSWTFPSPTGPQTSLTTSVTAHTTTNVTSTSAGVFTLTLTDRDNGCSSVLQVPIQQNLFPPKAVISGGNNFTVTCATQTVQLTNNSLTNITPASGFPTNQNVVALLWEGPTPQAPLSLSANYVGAVPGVYTMTAKDLNNGCTSKTTTTVFDNRIYPSAPSIATTTLDCSGIDTIRPSPVVTNFRYEWTPPKFTSVPGGTISLTKPKLPVNNPGEYAVVITNTANGCQITVNATVITGSLAAGFSANQFSGYAPLSVTFSNTSQSNSASNATTGISTIWSYGNGTSQTITPTSAVTTPTALYTQPGTYTVTTFSFKGSCSDTAIRYVHVDIPSKLTIPNVFTPNGDHVNDVFFLETSNLSTIDALIYDRWGHKVYELVSTTGNIEWDGTTMNGKDASAGTYFYVIKATGKDGQNYDTKGTITLYR